MSRLNIAGQILYADTTPASAANVSIIEVDGLPSGANDKIFTTTTDVNGRFSGRSTEWKDREGRVLGANIPDFMQLRFGVSVDGKTHNGPFILFGGQSAPIILPFGPRKPVSKARRELVQVILISQDLVGAERALYEFIETAAETLTRSLLGSSYNKLTFLKSQSATLAGFTNALSAAARSGVDAVDVIFTTHGNTGRMVFADATRPESQVREALLALPAAKRNKFRTVFSTACFGETHLDTWIGAGFNEASGSQGIYADSAVSYAPFLTAWAAEKTFAEAVDAANAADVGNLNDNAIRAYYTARNRLALASQIDSDRKRSGAGWTRIYSTP